MGLTPNLSERRGIVPPSEKEMHELIYKDWMLADGPGFDGWRREVDGTLRLWPMQGFACRAIGNRIPVMRIDYLRPPGNLARAGTLQVHLSAQQAGLLAGALLRAVETLE